MNSYTVYLASSWIFLSSSFFSTFVQQLGVRLPCLSRTQWVPFHMTIHYESLKKKSSFCMKLNKLHWIFVSGSDPNRKSWTKIRQAKLPNIFHLRACQKKNSQCFTIHHGITIEIWCTYSLSCRMFIWNFAIEIFLSRHACSFLQWKDVQLRRFNLRYPTYHDQTLAPFVLIKHLAPSHQSVISW